MIPGDLTRDELAAALRNAAAGRPTVTAAAELLIASGVGHWLSSSVFRSHTTITRDDGPPYADVDWAALTAAADRHAVPDTVAEVLVLRVACEVAAGWLADVDSCDQANVDLVCQTIRTAAGAR